MKRNSLYYSLLISRFDLLWFPLALWLLFLLLGVMRGLSLIEDTTQIYLAAVVPLAGGIMAAYAVLEDASLELRFSTPVRTMQILLERLLPVFTVEMGFALTYQLYALCLGADFSVIFASWFEMQFAWLVPLLSLMTLGCCVSLAAAYSTAGSLITGMVWLVQLVARGLFAADRFGQYVLVFMSGFHPEHPALVGNRIVLLSLSLLLFIVSWLLLQRTERYL